MDPSLHQKIHRLLKLRREGVDEGLNVSQADLSGALLNGADLGRIDLSGAKLELASLPGAYLEGANFRSASLREADLTGADLTKSSLYGADLTGVNWDDTILVQTDLRGANVRGTRGEPLSLAGARLNQATVERSQLTQNELASFLTRGAIFEAEDNSPESVPPPSVIPNSIVPQLRREEISLRPNHGWAGSPSIPPSKRAFDRLSRLIEDATLPDELPLSLRSPALTPLKIEPIASKMPQRGESFWGYQVVQEFSQGGIACSYLVDDGEQKYFLKVFNHHQQGAALQLPAFQRGLRLMNRLTELLPNTVQLHACSPDLTAYLCEFQEGGSLESLAEVNVSLEIGLEIFRKLCELVAAVHQLGGLVRSFKPSNILLDGLQPVLGEVDMVDIPSLAQGLGDVGGYGPYVAPEELERLGTRSPSADVYSLGRLLEYLLTGRAPSDPLLGQSTLEMRGDIPPFLSDLVKRCTAASPAERYQFVDEILDELSAYERNGASALINVPLRAPLLSRVPTPTSLAPALKVPGHRPATQDLESAAHNSPPTKRQPSGLTRKRELAIASFGLFTLLIGVLVALFGSRQVHSIETLWVFVAALGGLSIWFLPKANTHNRAYRLALWLTGGWLIYLPGPLPLSQLRWSYDLHNGDSLAKEQAISSLISSGQRDFSGQNMKQLILSRQDLSRLNLRGADLRGSDLNHSFLRDSNFSGADLNDVILNGADLGGAQLHSARSLEGAHCDRDTRLPEGVRCVNNRLSLTP